MKKFIILTIAIIIAMVSVSQASMVKDLNAEISVFKEEMTKINVIFNQLKSVETKELEKINSIPSAANNWQVLNQKMEYTRRNTVKKIKLLIKQCGKFKEKKWLENKINLKKYPKISQRLKAVLKDYMEVFNWIEDVEVSDMLHRG